MVEQQSVFVKIDEYKETIGILDNIKSKVSEAKDTLAKINELRTKEHAELEQWKSHIEEVDRKVDFIDKTFFEPEN